MDRRRWIAWDGRSRFPKTSFATEKEAWAEAERLAALNKGVFFAVIPVLPAFFDGETNV